MEAPLLLTLAKPIYNDPCERMALAAMMRDEGQADHGLSLLRKDEFHSYAHQLIYSAIAHLRAGNHPCGPDLVYSRIVESGQREAFGLDENGGGGNMAASYIASVVENDPTGAMLDYAASKIRDCSIRRAIIHQAHESIRDAIDGVNPGEEMAAEASEALAKLAMPVEERGPKLCATLVHQATKRIDQQVSGVVTKLFLRTGFGGFDNIAGGIEVGCLTVLAARPSVGKSAFALRITEAVAEAGTPVLFISMEMSNAETINRYMAGVSRVHLARIRGQSQLEANQIDKLAEFAGSKWASLPIYFDDRPRQKLSRLVSTVRLHVSRYKVGMVVIDYLGLIPREDMKVPMHEHLGNCTSTLKALAIDLQVGMVLLAQVNRGSEDRGAESPPKLSDLKGSGDIEQDGDAIIVLHRPKLSDGAVDEIDLHVLKQRNGPVGCMTIQYIKAFVRFEENMPIF